MRSSNSLTGLFDAIREVLSRWRYAVLMISVTATLAIAQITLLLMLFWAKFGFNEIIVRYGKIYFPPEASLPTFSPLNTLFRFSTFQSTRMIMLSISPSQFFGILLISALAGIYASLMIYYRNCITACRRERSIGAAGFGVGGIIPIVTSSVSVVTGCCGVFIILPLVSGILTPFLEVGADVFGLGFSILFRTAGIMILIISILWLSNKIKTNTAE